jgi:cob(I)alamin adenosyltransferase
MADTVKIYTKAGDDGKTRTINRKVCRKNSPLICVLGELDELNSFIGMAKSSCDGSIGRDAEFLVILDRIQDDVYKIGAELAGADFGKIGNGDVAWVEEMIDAFIAEKKSVRFVKPGGRGELSARLHVCRSVSRRVERSAYDLRSLKKMKYIRQYLNRLSDLFFTMGEC